MKKYLLIVIITIIFISGCSNNDQKVIEDRGLDNEIVDNYLGIKVESKKEIKCYYLSDVKYMSTQLFVTNNNKIYEYGIDKMYSNDQNCHQLGVNPRYNYLDNLKLGQIVGLRISEMIDDKKQHI